MRESETSAYMLIFRETTPERYQSMSDEERRKRLNDWNAWCDELAGAGRLQSGNPLLPEGAVVSEKGVDGPFTEAKELVGGYFLVTAASLAEATEIARQSPNLPYGMSIEVRPVAGACHLARSLGMRTMREPVI